MSAAVFSQSRQELNIVRHYRQRFLRELWIQPCRESKYCILPIISIQDVLLQGFDVLGSHLGKAYDVMSSLATPF